MFNNALQFRESHEVIIDVLQCPEATHALKASEGDDHLRLVVRVFVDIRVVPMQLLC